MQRECSILFYEGYVSLAPTIINISKSLEKDGYLVTIFATQNNEIPQAEKIGTRVKIIYFRKFFKLFLFCNRPSTLRPLVRILEVFIFSFQSFAALLQSNFQAKNLKKNINIGVDLHGSVVALLWFYFFNQKFIFLSLEIEQHPSRKLFKYIYKPLNKIAELAYKKAECVIVQDEDRFKSLCEYYQYQPSKVLYLPNSPINDLPPDINTTNFFREKFNLSKEKFPYIILQAGQLNENVCSKSLAHAFASIDNGCALIFHGVEATGLYKEEHPYIQSLRQLNSKNLFLSLNPLPFEEVDKIYASATIGLALYAMEYANGNDNYSKIAKASGKLAQYLKHGKPVLVSNYPSLSQLVQKYQFGIVIKNPSDSQEINLAVETILSNYNLYSNNAKSCFKAEFDLKKEMEDILSFINSLPAEPGI